MKQRMYISCDTNLCVECHACEAACKAANNVETGVKLRWVDSIWQGEYPHVANFSRSIGCYHCKNAPCIKDCPSGAIKRDEKGIVRVDADRCQGNRACEAACPYGIPQFGKDGRMQKCEFCHDLEKPGDLPVCIKTCPSGALTLKQT